ncbi:MAG: PorT family protein [Flavobacterium sp.]|nr:MAG: PorT family protein [Flavobacterium sp.]
MKKAILSAIAVMIFGYINAQQTKFGVKGGLNISSFSGNNNSKGLLGFHIGGLAEIKIIERLSVQPEILFSTQGASFDPNGDIIGGDTKLNYINIPVLAKFYITKKVTVESGPQIGFLVSARDTGYDVKDMYRSTDLGINFGGGYNFTDHFAVGLRYTVGLSRVLDSSIYDYNSYHDSAKNSNLALSLEYKF